MLEVKTRRKKLLALLLLFFGGAVLASAAGFGFAPIIQNFVQDFIQAVTYGLAAYLIFKTLEGGFSGGRIFAALAEGIIVVIIVKYAQTIVNGV